MNTGLQIGVKATPTFTPMHSGILQRACACGQHTDTGGECEECRQKRDETLQRAAVNTNPINSAPPIVYDVLRSPGQPLDTATRRFMEPRFGYDFSNVRVHTDAQAAESARAVHALAYTVGRNIAFGAGQYAPSTSAGQRLLAYELTHVVQQQSGYASLQSSLRVDSAGDTAEREADSVANAVFEGLPAPAIRTIGFGTAIQTAGDRDPGTPSPPAPAPSPPAAGPVCGPDVTAQVTAAVTRTKTTFGVRSQIPTGSFSGHSCVDQSHCHRTENTGG